MDLRYSYNDSRIAEGERSMVYSGGNLYVRTGVRSQDSGQITYTLREVYDAAAHPPANTAPVATDGVAIVAGAKP